jgi:O-acetyl-ADP-ribose deacetylase (regulator of RNase III)
MPIDLIQGDITQQDTDAIVNAAHEALMGGGGVDGAIHRKAGYSLMTECLSIPEVEKGVRCPMGQARITTGCALKTRYIIHTVAPKFVGWKSRTPSVLHPIYGRATEGTNEDLATCYINCLKLASKYNIRTIAFPSLGTGGHAFPIELACPIAVKAVRSLEKDFDLIRFVAFDPDTYHEFEKAINNEE